MPVSKSIKNPDALWKLFEGYRKAAKEKPRRKYHLNIKTGKMVPEPLEVPLTKEGFYNYCADHADIQTLKDYFSNREGRYKDFVPICSRILQIIRQDQIEGGMVGQYNPSITQRLNGLTEKVETELTGKDGKPIETNQKIEVTLKLS